MKRTRPRPKASRSRKPGPGRPWPPPIKRKARGANLRPSVKLSSDPKLPGSEKENLAVVNPPAPPPEIRFSPINDEHLWAQVAPGATWRPCPHHGEVPRPLLREWQFADGSYHIKINCPSCLHSLGYAKRIKTYEIAPPEVRETVFRAYLADAEARGWKPGSAYYRFKSRFGCEPDPAWRLGFEEGHR